MGKNITIWQSPNTEKFLRDKFYEKTEAKEFCVKLFQNETEGVQFHLTPAVDVNEFTVCVSDLKNGEFVIPKTDLEVSVVKYIELTRSSAGTVSELGWYPDALLPMSVSAKYGENKILANKNQGVWITVKTRENTKAGEYKGIVKITVDGETYEYPLIVTVWDFALPVANHTKQYFIISKKEMLRGEGEKSLELIERYFNKALDYRINGSSLPFNHRTETFEEGFANFLVAMKKYYNDCRCTFYNICFFINKETYADLNYERMEYVFKGIADECIKDNVNYFEKALTYIWIIDEPNLSPERKGYCKKILPKYAEERKRIAEEYRTKGEIGAVVAESIINLPNVITAAVLAELLPDDPDEYSVMWCPPFDAIYHNENKVIWELVNQGEKWWYGCDWPTPPYPTYHIDDKLISSRLLSWMQFEQNITGNLYWRFNFCKISEERGGVPDPYRIANPCERTNGEGFLVYPGSPYGLDCFVPTIRLESIRDGIEDYEALYCLRELWNNNAKSVGKTAEDVNKVMSPIYSRMYDLVALLDEPMIDFQEAREIVAKMLIASKRFGFFIEDFNEYDKTVTFISNANVSCVGGTVNKLDNTYVLKIEQEKAIVTVGDQSFNLYVNTIKHSVVYGIEFNWRATAKKYNIDANPEDIVKPYYDVLKNKAERNYKTCAIDLQKLNGFIWRTEMVIRKKPIDGGIEVELTLPKGVLKTEEAYSVKEIDETAKIYTIKTEKQKLKLEVENEKGSFTANLYLF